MTIDTSVWKIYSPEWKQEREEQWPIFNRWLTQYYDSDKDRSLSGSLSNAKIFYDSGMLDKNTENFGSSVGYEAALALHPSINAEAVRELTNFYYTHGKRSDLKGHFRHYFLERLRYLSLITSGALSEKFMLALLEGAYGKSLDEAAEILGFDPKKSYLDVFRSVGGKLLTYAREGENDSTTYDIACHMLPFYLETLTKLTDEEARQCDLRFNTILKAKKKLSDLDLVEDVKRREFIERYFSGTKSRLDSMTPYMRQNMQQLFE